jgi:hypothetical protein
MKAEPQTIFIGIVDFFAVLLPGAVVVGLFQKHVYKLLFPSVFPELNPEAGWAVFVFASYLAGHFIFLLGSRIDSVWGKKAQMRSGLLRWLRRLLFEWKSDPAMKAVEELQKKYFADVDPKPINGFQWAKARLMIECPAAFLDVQRVEADSKFFRSFFVVLLVVAAWLAVPPYDGKPYLLLALGCVALAALSFWRYAERRSKAIEQVCYYVITLEHCPPGKIKAE